MNPVAAIDCGTNSTRLLVATGNSDGRVTTLERRLAITRLGAGVDRTGGLDPAAIERTLAVLTDYRSDLDRHGVGGLRITATSAVRDAANRDDFLGPAEAILGFRPEVLSGEEEGRLAFSGATAELELAAGPFLVVDIGGGSTEFVVGTNEAEGVVSIDVGCERLTERYLHHDPPTAEELSAAISVTTAHLEDVARELPATRDARTMIGVAGTATTAAAVEIGLATYDRDAIHHFRLTRSAAEDVFRTLATEARAERIHNPGLEEARADVIVAGCCILVAVMRYFDTHEMLISESDILDALAASLLPTGGIQ